MFSSIEDRGQTDRITITSCALLTITRNLTFDLYDSEWLQYWPILVEKNQLKGRASKSRVLDFTYFKFKKLKSRKIQNLVFFSFQFLHFFSENFRFKLFLPRDAMHPRY